VTFPLYHYAGTEEGRGSIPGWDLQESDGTFKAAAAMRGPLPPVVQTVVKAVKDFVVSIGQQDLRFCDLPTASDVRKEHRKNAAAAAEAAALQAAAAKRAPRVSPYKRPNSVATPREPLEFEEGTEAIISPTRKRPGSQQKRQRVEPPCNHLRGEPEQRPEGRALTGPGRGPGQPSPRGPRPAAYARDGGLAMEGHPQAHPAGFGLDDRVQMRAPAQPLQAREQMRAPAQPLQVPQQMRAPTQPLQVPQQGLPPAVPGSSGYGANPAYVSQAYAPANLEGFPSASREPWYPGVSVPQQYAQASASQMYTEQNPALLQHPQQAELAAHRSHPALAPTGAAARLPQAIPAGPTSLGTPQAVPQPHSKAAVPLASPTLVHGPQPSLPSLVTQPMQGGGPGMAASRVPAGIGSVSTPTAGQQGFGDGVLSPTAAQRLPDPATVQVISSCSA
jgi:hypothetical protein